MVRLLTQHAPARRGGGVVMLQSSGSFFAYEPVLKALQRMEHLPLQQHLVPPLPGAAACLASQPAAAACMRVAARPAS